jgi:drug/metabolite transporter (DMT)-like permease
MADRVRASGVGRPAATVDASESALPATGIALLVTLTLAWGINWPMMKLALAEVPPWTFRSICLMVGGGVLLLLTRATGGALAVRADQLPQLALTSLFNITGWHLCSAYALLYTGSGRASIIGYTMPLWASALSVLILHAKVTERQIMALGLGMAALVLLIGNDLRVVGDAPLGALLMVAAALSWALGTVLVKRFSWQGLPVMALTGWQLLIGGAPIVLGWWLLEPVPDLGALGWSAAFGLAYATFVAMVFCHTAYFKLVSLLPAHVAAISVLAVPVVGVVSSALIVGERVGLAEIGALVLVVAGLFLLIRPRRA